MQENRMTIKIRNSLYRFLMAKYRSARGASHQPVFMGDYLGKGGGGRGGGLVRWQGGGGGRVVR